MTHLLNRREGFGLMAGLAVAAALPSAVRAQPAGRWAGSWGQMLQKASTPTALKGQTVAQTVTLSVGGPALRVRVSNRFGAKALAVGAVSVRSGGQVQPLAFGGKPGVSIAPGALAVSDAVRLRTRPGEKVEVRIFVPGEALAETFHRTPDNKAAQLSGTGDFTRSAALDGAKDHAPVFLSDVEVEGARAPVLVILSDTKSAGPGTWPEMFVARTAGKIAVVNKSQFAGLMTLGAPGEGAVARFDTDVLGVAGASQVLIFTGNNDLIQPGAQGSNGRMMLDPALTQSAEELIWALNQMALRARAAGLSPIGGTWLAYDGVTIPGYSTPEKQAKREAVNDWIRRGGAFDKVIDFDAALRDPAKPSRLLSAYDSGNRFTPSAAGYQAMAEVAAKTLRL